MSPSAAASVSFTPSFEANRGAEWQDAWPCYRSIVPSRRIFRCSCITP